MQSQVRVSTSVYAGVETRAQTGAVCLSCRFRALRRCFVYMEAAFRFLVLFHAHLKEYTRSTQDRAFWIFLSF